MIGWETSATEDTEWDGIYERTGRLVCVMIGDDRRFTFDPGEVHPIEREAFCGVCGQIGCGLMGLEATVFGRSGRGITFGRELHPREVFRAAVVANVTRAGTRRPARGT